MLVLTLASLALAQQSDATDDDDDVEVVVVTASRSPAALGEAPVAVEVITREEIEATGSESLAELLEEQPGLQIEDTVVGQSIRMQGMNAEHTLILVDGQRVLGRKDGVIDLSRFPMDDIERIEIVKGPSSSLYGSDAMGGVVHIITKRGSEGRDVGLHVRYGTLQRLDATADVKAGTETVKHKVDLGWHSSDAWDLDESDVATTSSAFQQGDFAYGATVTPDPDVQLDFTVSYMQRRLEGVSATETGAVFDNRSIVEDSRAALGGWWTAGPKTKLTVRVSGSFFRNQALADQRGSAALDTVQVDTERLAESTIQLDHGLSAAGEHVASLGVDGLYQDITSDRLGPGKGDRQRIAVFAQDVWRIELGASTLTVSPGMRLDVDSQFGTAPTPRLALALASGDLTFRLSAGTGFRAPDFRELYLLFENPGVGYVVQGNEDLRAERSRNFNGSVEYAPTKRIGLSFQAYRNDIADLINFDIVDAPVGSNQLFQYQNIDRAYTQGFDVQARWRPRPFTLELGYALVDTLDKDLRQPLAGRVPHRVTGVAAVDLPRDVSVRTQWGYSTRRTLYADLDGDDVADPIKVPECEPDATLCTLGTLTLDARAVWKGDPVEVFAGIDNVFDTGQQTLAPTVPRFVYAGLNIRGRKP
ncbi:MAG: TonB-dependent receptor [Myxococcota bacterium]